MSANNAPANNSPAIMPATTSGNSAFEIRQGASWSRGLDNFLRTELTGWFGTRTWLWQLLIWVGIIDGILAVTLYAMGSDPAVSNPENDGAMLYSIFTGMFAAIGVVIIMQEAILGERLNGTAAWVLSKPLSRPGFILSKLIGNLAGILVCMVLAPGLIAYVLISWLGVGSWLPFGSFLAGMACLGIALFFYQAMTLMFGALFSNRGAVIGLSLAFVFGQQFLIGMLPFLGRILPIGIYLPKENEPTLASALLLGQPAPELTPALASLALGILFVVIAVWKFNRIEL